MTVRATMFGLIDELRGMTDTSPADFTVGAITYWSDQQLQDILDKQLTVEDYSIMQPFPTRNGSITEYKTYLTNQLYWEKLPDVRDAYGSIVGTAQYTFEPVAGYFDFTANQWGSSRFISGYHYNMNAAAAEVWRKKMGQAAKMYDFSPTRGETLSRSQFMAQCKQMWQYYAGLGGPNVIQIYREDTRPPIEGGDDD